MKTVVYLGEVRDALTRIEPGTVRAVVTSVPYFGLRRYTDDDREIGTGTLAEWLADLTATFAQVVPLLTDNATVWLNVGDSAAGSGGAGGDHNRGNSKEKLTKYRQGKPVLADGTVLAGGQWCDTPGRLLHALQDDGWLCRSKIVWDKGQIKPESVRHTRRPGVQTEMVYMLARSMRYTFDGTDMVDRGDVWRIPPGNGSGGKAAMPRALAARCLALAGVYEGTVLDPFMGAGTTLDAAQIRGLDSVGVDLDAEAAVPAAARLGADLIRV